MPTIVAFSHIRKEMENYGNANDFAWYQDKIMIDGIDSYSPRPRSRILQFALLMFGVQLLDYQFY